MENPIKMDDLGGKTHYFRKHTYGDSTSIFSKILYIPGAGFRSSINSNTTVTRTNVSPIHASCAIIRNMFLGILWKSEMTPGGWQLLKLCCYLVEFDCQLRKRIHEPKSVGLSFRWTKTCRLQLLLHTSLVGWCTLAIKDVLVQQINHVYSIVFLHSCTEWHLLKVHFALENAGKPLECRNEGRFKPCSICSGESNWRWQTMQLVKSAHQVSHDLATSANMAIR